MVDWVEVLNVICIALPLPFMTIHRKHIYMTLIQKYLTARQQRILDIITFTIIFLFSALVAWRVSIEALYSLKYLGIQRCRNDGLLVSGKNRIGYRLHHHGTGGPCSTH